jgi:phenylacetate-coenzyme A ligase PaaK-like adenylate-forming protein
MNPADYSYLLRYSVAKKGALKAYKNAIKHQHLQPEELENLSWLKTQKLLAYAYNNVKWYNDTFKAINLHP